MTPPPDDVRPIGMAIPEPYQPEWALLEEPEDENPFMTAGVELLKEAMTLAAMAAELYRPEPMARDEAIRCGLLVRAVRLMRSSLRDVCDGDGEQQIAIFRQLLDTATTLLYLHEDVDGSRHQAYVLDSLVAEREFLRTIETQQAQTGEALDIERRIQRSIDRTAASAGVNPAEIPARGSIGWPSSQQRIAALGPTAYDAFRTGSAAIHGTWSDLERNYLQSVDGGFRSRLDPLTPRPQPLFAGALLICEMAGTYLESAGTDDERTLLDPALDGLLERLSRADRAHEAYLAAL